MATVVAAISGGVDSVALLHMLAQKEEGHIIVAHFDHGIREDSQEDALFVEALAGQYGLPFEMMRVDLGRTASEEKARSERYAFLRDVAEKHQAQLVTAHHADDTVETIAINFHRGTGWRGLAVLDSDVSRPLLHLTKRELLTYAEVHSLEWREDSTNATDAYLRNRIRRQAGALSHEQKTALLSLRTEQLGRKRLIEQEVSSLIGTGPSYSRYFFTHVPVNVAIECLRHVSRAKLTRPQLERLLIAVKTAQPKHVYHAGAGLTFDFTTRNFSLSLLK